MEHTPPQLVVFGEALVDLKGTGALGFQGYVGGSPLNVAVAAARLGLPSALATRVSTDFFGEAIVSHLKANGVGLDLLERGPEPTTLAFVSFEGGGPRYSFRNEGAADLAYTANLPWPEGVEAVHFGGSVNPLFEPVSGRVLELVRSRREGRLLHLDPNVRPTLLGNREVYRARLAPWLPLAHWLKLSREDLEWLWPGADEAATARGWLEAGVSVVVVTDGGEGARLYRRGREPLTARAPRVSVVDTVGAGDTFSGATLAALLERGLASPGALEAAGDEELRAVLEFGARAAAVNCTRAGADPPTRAELEAFAG